MSCFFHLPPPTSQVLPVQCSLVFVCVAQHRPQHRPRRVCLYGTHGRPLLPPSPLSNHTEQRKVSLHGDEKTEQIAEASSCKADGLRCPAWPSACNRVMGSPSVQHPVPPAPPAAKATYTRYQG